MNFKEKFETSSAPAGRVSSLSSSEAKHLIRFLFASEGSIQTNLFGPSKSSIIPFLYSSMEYQAALACHDGRLPSI